MIDALIKGITLGLLLAISVGPIVFTVIKQSLNNGKKGGLAFISGIFLSDVFLVVCSNAFTGFFTGLKTYTNQLAIAGSILLISIGVYFVFFKKVKVNQEGQQIIMFRKRDYARIFLAGALMNLLNPGIIVFWLSTATMFIDHTLRERLIIFSIALLLALGADLAKVFLANTIRKKLTPKNIHRINQVNGLILIGFGIAMIAGLVFYHARHN
jgi:threonine/homoserine/homoserine lactone efflux protein